VERVLGGVGVHVGVGAVIEDEVEPVQVGDLADGAREGGKRRVEAKAARAQCRLVENVEQEQHGALTVGLPDLLEVVAGEKPLVEEDAVVDEGPVPSRDVLATEGVAVLLAEPSRRGESDVGLEPACSDGMLKHPG